MNTAQILTTSATILKYFLIYGIYLCNLQVLFFSFHNKFIKI